MISQLIADSGVTQGWLSVAALGIAVVSYFLGCFNGAVVVSNYILRDDVRTHGSGNAGLTNFYRTFGGPLTAVVILSDVVKAVLAVLFAMLIAGGMSPVLVPLGKYWAGMFCLLGHMYPCTFQFRGGKGILSGGTIAFMLDWRVALVVWGGFIILAVLTRYVSLGSCWAGLSFPFVTAYVYQDTLVIIISAVVGALILWRHRANIVRLVKGTESKFTLNKKAEVEPAGELSGEPEEEPAEGNDEETEKESAEDAAEGRSEEKADEEPIRDTEPEEEKV